MRPDAASFLDTIVALATPLGRSAIAIVRLSGSDVASLLAAVAPELPRPPAARRATVTQLSDDAGLPLDRGIVTFFPSPSSYTGEDVAEISVHGSPVVAARLLATLLRRGARLARPGEFTERAFHSGKIDLVEAEAVAELIESRTEAAARLSARRMEGALSQRLAAVREDLLSAAARLAATIDFSEDVGEAVDPQVVATLDSASRALRQLSATYETGRLLSAGSRVAVLGRPNAGKSTLFNALLGSARAIVTEVPGTTRDTLEGTLDIGGVPVQVVDTAGLRESDDLVERLGVERSRVEAARADAILYVFDVSAGWSEEDAAGLAAFDGAEVMVVANKIDRGEERRSGEPPTALRLCGLAVDAGGRLRALLEERIGSKVSTEATSEVLGSLRQKELVDRAGAAASRALEATSSGVAPEYAVTHVHDALDAFADLFGETSTDDVLARVFATFCIGK